MGTSPRSSVGIVGGGPVGLWLALEIAASASGRSVVVYEKRNAYVRSQKVRVNAADVCRPRNESLRRLLHDVAGSLVGIQTLENALTAMCADDAATTPRIELRRREIRVADVRELCQRHGVVVFADGARSAFREAFFGGVADVRTFARAVTVDYATRRRAFDADPIEDAFRRYAAAKAAGTLVTEVAKPESGRVAITFVSRGVSADATFGKPITAKDAAGPRPEGVSARAWNVTLDWARCRGHSPTDLRISTYPLHAYRARSFWRSIGGSDAFLVGDAAFGVPYRAGLSAGWSTATRLSDLLDTAYTSDTAYASYASDAADTADTAYASDTADTADTAYAAYASDTAYASYSSFVVDTFEREAFAAAAKAVGVRIAAGVIKACGALPWNRHARRSAIHTPTGVPPPYPPPAERESRHRSESGYTRSDLRNGYKREARQGVRGRHAPSGLRNEYNREARQGVRGRHAPFRGRHAPSGRRRAP